MIVAGIILWALDNENGFLTTDKHPPTTVVAVVLVFPSGPNTLGYGECESNGWEFLRSIVQVVLWYVADRFTAYGH